MPEQTPDERTDEEIAAEVQAGDAEAFRILVDRYEAKMARYAKRFLFASDDAKDLLQEIFIKAYVNIRSFDTTRRFSPWLYRIAHNEFVNALKKKNKDRETISLFYADVLFPHPVAKESADEGISRREIKEVLEGSLEKLGPKYREPLVLYYLEDMDYKEIAEVLRIPVSTVGVRLQRGKTLLRKFVKEKNG
jgi:RNA polymerase sigma-70 factor (ECF subfamily)